MIKLNEKAQVLVIFVILLPLICLLVFFFIQKLLIINEENHLNSIAYDACSYYIKTRNYQDTVNLLIENEANLTDIKIKEKDSKISVTFQKEIDDLFHFFQDNNKLHIEVTCNR